MKNYQLLSKLMQIQAVKFGQFTLKSGMTSPIYIDLRLIVSYPDLLSDIAEAFWGKIQTLDFDFLCGVPYTALPITTALSIIYRKPMVMRRKEAKEYGTKKIIEGAYTQGQRCLIIEDLITTGLSIFETIDPLEKEGLQVEDVAVLIDREQGGQKKLSQHGYRLHAVFTMTELLDHLSKSGLIDHSTTISVREFIIQNQAT
jgi:orotate phosphoribosyltransferase